jgi:hypothetical protein
MRERATAIIVVGGKILFAESLVAYGSYPEERLREESCRLLRLLVSYLRKPAR